MCKFFINRKLIAVMLEKNKKNNLEGSTNSVLMENILENHLMLYSLIEEAAEEIENCYGKDTDLTVKIRELIA